MGFRLLLVWLACPSLLLGQGFTQNNGQWPQQVLASLAMSSGRIFIEKDGLTIHRWGKLSQYAHELQHEKGDPEKKGGNQHHVWKIKFLDASEMAVGIGSNPLPGIENYFLGYAPNKAVVGVKSFEKFSIKNLYQDVDLEFFIENDHLKFNVLVHHPKALPKIKWKYLGLDEIPRLLKGIIQYSTAMGIVKENIPKSWIKSGQEIPINYQKKNDIFSFQAGIDINEPLCIDPQIVFSSYTGSVADNWGFTATYDTSGNAYSGGIVFASGFPVNIGAFQTTWGGGIDVNPYNGDMARDIAIFKYSPDGKQRVYATYIGGSHNEQPHSMVVNNQGELCVMATTFSENFPAVLQSGFQNALKGQSDLAIFKLSPDGKSLTGGTFYGGFKRDGLNGELDDDDRNSSPVSWNYGDIFRGEIICDASDNLYIASCTSSREDEGLTLKNIPGGTGCITNFQGGSQDGIVAKFSSSLEQLIWATYLGGEATDACFGLHKGKYLFICGGTNSRNLAQVNGYQTTYQGGKADGMVYRLNPYSGAIEAATYMGTPLFESAFLIQADGNGHPWITGQTASNQWPVTPPIYEIKGAKQFITRLDDALKNITRSTVFGSGRNQPDISVSAFLVDKCERIFVSGWGGKVNVSPRGNGGTTHGMPVTQNAVQPKTDGSDFYLAVFNRNADTLLYATYFGGTDPFGSGSPPQTPTEHVDGGTSRFDVEGKVYQSVCAGCGGQSIFPTTPKVWGETNKSSNCNNALFKIDFENLNLKPLAFDSVFEVYATDTFTFRVSSKDLDRYDSLFMNPLGYIMDSFFISPPMFPPDSGVGAVASVFRWVPGCDISSKDTQIVKIQIRDNNQCPSPDTSYTTIRLTVKAPPTIHPPKVVCVAHVDDNSVKVSWEEPDTSRFFGGYFLFKVWPNNTIQVMDTFYPGDSQVFLDAVAPNHLVENYCYFLSGFNRCGIAGDSSYWACSAQELTTPMDSGYVYTATVENNRYVKIIWLKSKEPDFGHYLLYRKTGGMAWDLKNPYKILSSLPDTFWVDSNVTVSDSVYCYRLRIADKCGHISAFSNQGCTMVLQGQSYRFQHQLHWNLYQGWDQEAEFQVIKRNDSVETFRLIRRVQGNATRYTDFNIPYEWGRYGYKIVAQESTKGRGAVSESNEIKLVQPPVVFIPNSFSPNDDGLNDLWGWVPFYVKDFQLSVFNRWGEKIFETFEPQHNWNGFYRDKPSHDNAFIWQCIYTGFDDSRHTLSGMVFLIH